MRPCKYASQPLSHSLFLYFLFYCHMRPVTVSDNPMSSSRSATPAFNLSTPCRDLQGYPVDHRAVTQAFCHSCGKRNPANNARVAANPPVPPPSTPLRRYVKQHRLVQCNDRAADISVLAIRLLTSPCPTTTSQSI